MHGLVRFFGLALPAGLAWLPASAAPQAAVAWQPTAAASSRFLQQSTAGAWSSAVGGGSRSHLPKSTLGGPIGQVCSVDTTDAGNPPSCSATGTTAARCSAQCDAEQRCSAFLALPGVTRRANCSTFGASNALCSVLQPGTPPNGPSQCSAFGGAAGTGIQCSVMRGTGSNQFCSAQNPAQTEMNQCSTFSTTGGPNAGRLNCSVLASSNASVGNSCSVRGLAGTHQFVKNCSAFVANSNCSVALGQPGRCTTLSGPAGTCSAFAHGAHCSVIGGPAGTACTQ